MSSRPNVVRFMERLKGAYMGRASDEKQTRLDYIATLREVYLEHGRAVSEDFLERRWQAERTSVMAMKRAVVEQGWRDLEAEVYGLQDFTADSTAKADFDAFIAHQRAGL